jgi:NAD(P)-dependent dehydrogenase (short-subunit alcohol dehydrogenase family)
MTKAFYLENKIALITGGASGIGAATARELASAGAHVIVADLNLAAAEALAAELPNARAVKMDVTDSASIALALDGVQSLDILVNNAGVGLVGDISRTSEEDFERVMRVNVSSIFLVTKAALPLLLATRGCIVNIGSVAGAVGVKQRFACGLTASLREQCRHHSLKAIWTNITRTRKRRFARSLLLASQ